MKKIAAFIASGSGMGADAAKHLSSKGYDVAIMSSSGKGEELAKRLGGFGFTGSKEARKVLYDVADLLDPIGAGKITNWGRAPDIAILNDEGVPVMSLKVDNSKYFWYHHTSADTFDKVDYNEFNDCIATMAIMAYVVADMEKRLPR